MKLTLENCVTFLENRFRKIPKGEAVVFNEMNSGFFYYSGTLIHVMNLQIVLMALSFLKGWFSN